MTEVEALWFTRSPLHRGGLVIYMNAILVLNLGEEVRLPVFLEIRGLVRRTFQYRYVLEKKKIKRKKRPMNRIRA
jgi:hypothetical protein